MKAKLYTPKGNMVKEVTLPEDFDSKNITSLLAQAVRVYENKGHVGLSKVKTRSEVIRTKKKLYKQKGTGGARHGAKSAPIFVGGGVAHGPKGVKRILSLPNKMRKAVLKQAMSLAFSMERAVLIQSFKNISKTSDASVIIDSLRKALKIKRATKLLLVLSAQSYHNSRFFKNISNIETVSIQTMNAYKLSSAGYIFFEDLIFVKEGKNKS